MSPSPSRPHRVLLIEDNPGDVLLIREMLSESKSADFELLYPVDRLELGLKVIDAGQVDILLLDLHLPDSSGIETYRTAHASAPHLPIIVLSGMDNEELSIQTVHEGAQDYVVKGQFDSRLLSRAMRYACERQVIEKRLSKERDLLHTLLDNLPDRIFFKDRESRFFLVNPAMVKLFAPKGVKSDKEIIGKTDFDFFPKEVAEKTFADEIKIMLTGQPIDGQVEKKKFPDGSVGWTITTKLPLRDRNGYICGVTGISRDITEQKRAEESLLEANASLEKRSAELQAALEDLKKTHEERQSLQLQLIEAEKMKSIGRLAAGVAHEVKNPLATITMGLEYLSHESFSGDGQVPEILHEMRDAVSRADSVIRGLLDFSAPQQLEVKNADLNSIINRSLVLVRGEMSGDGFHVITELQPDLPPVKIDAGKISQVFINIFTNAIHSMGEGGTLTVRTFSKQLTGVGPNVDDSRSESFRVGDTVITIEVDDTGPGVPEEKLGKIFEPFFTTKPTGKGNGLGLSVTKTIIDLHGGTIDIRNRSEGGARVTITLKA